MGLAEPLWLFQGSANEIARVAGDSDEPCVATRTGCEVWDVAARRQSSVRSKNSDSLILDLVNLAPAEFD